MEENPIKRRFRSALIHFCDKKWKRKQKALASACGVSDATISEIKNGNNAASPELQMKIVDIMGCSLDEFLAIGEYLSGSSIECTLSKPCVTEPYNRPIIVHVQSEPEKDFMLGISDRYQAIPLYESGKLAAGVHGAEFDPHEVPDSMVVVYKPELKDCSHHHLVAVKVGGYSMEPTITQGSIVVIDLSDKEESRGKIFAVNTPDAGLDTVSIKRVIRWKHGFILVSDNKDVDPEPTELDWNRLCVGRVVWMWRDIRNV
jgi:transcriptional regulator with XRE-family HTH domain